MKIEYMVERFLSDLGVVEVIFWAAEAPALTERLSLPLLNQDGLCPSTQEEVLARIEAAIPVSWMETKIKRVTAKQDTSHIASLQGVRQTASLDPMMQGQLQIKVLGT